MTLIKSISGIRGTIGGKPGEGLTPVDATKFAAAYGTWIIQNNTNKKPIIVIGRDARISGQMISDLVTSTLQGLGINVIDLANLHSCAFIATQDLGKLHTDLSFEVLGRFDASDVRGCNQLVS